jgi:hypothetical protein
MSAFVLSSPMCAPSFPFTFGRLAGLEPGGLSGAAAAAKHVSDLTAADLPSLARAPLKALAHSLACALVQMGLDVATSAFAVGSTAKLVGNSVCHMLDSTGGLSLGSIAQDLGGDVLADNIADAVGGGRRGGRRRKKREASLLIVDRTLDLSTPCGHRGTVLDRALAALARVVPGEGEREDGGVVEGGESKDAAQHTAAATAAPTASVSSSSSSSSTSTSTTMAFTHLDLGSAVPGPARPGGFSTAGIELASAAAAAAAGATSAASVLRAMVTGTDGMALDVAFAAVARIASAEDGVSFYADADENKGESSGGGSSGSSGGENKSVADRARLLRVRLDDLHARAPGGCFRHRATLLVVAAVAEALVEGTSERFGALESSERLQVCY